MADNDTSIQSETQQDQTQRSEPRPAEQGGEDDAKQRQRDVSRNRARPWVRLGLIAFILAVVLGGVYYWWSTRFSVSTDDAYTEGRAITIAPHVAGYVTELDVNDNQYVHQGQVLMRIDPRNYRANMSNAEATLEQVQGQLEGARFASEVAKQNFPGQLKQAQGQLLMAQGQEFLAESEYKRQHGISHAATTQQAIDQSTAQLKQAQGQLQQAQGLVQQNIPVEPNVGNVRSRVSQQSGSLRSAEAQLENARLNLEWTVIRAPHDGWISQRNVERGNYVTAGQSLFSIVEPDIWIVANFKETQLVDMRADQPVKISVDAYPFLHLIGHVDSIQNGSGAQFSAFPPENATGNFVKIVQRVPVKIIIDDGLDPNNPLPLGLSVVPTVNIKSGERH